MRYIDSHAHLDAPQFDDDREEVLARMYEHGVGALCVGVDEASSRAVVSLAQTHDVILGAVIGTHPTEGLELPDTSYIAELAQHECVVGIGECGFDYYRTPRDDVYVHQREVFEAQVAHAAECDLPLMLHVRDTKGSDAAHTDTLEILRLYQKQHGDTVRGNVHFYTHTKEIARAYLELGFTITFSGVITFAPELHEVARDIPRDMVLVESDAPYAAPVPHRGKRNEPLFVIDTLAALAAIRSEETEELRRATVENTQRLFGLKTA